MKEMELKYGCNPNQKPARIFIDNGELPLTILNGKPGYINLLDALNGWQLVRELKQATGLPAATSFKHVSPAGAALGLPLSDELRAIYFAPADLSPLGCAYVRARGADRMSAFGDFIALSDVCDEATARLIEHEVSDGIIAPGFEPVAVEILKKKRKGSYPVIAIDPAYEPKAVETREVFGISFEQGRNEYKIDNSALDQIVTKKTAFPAEARRDLVLALITLKYTQSNSVCYTYDGQTIGVGAGQQSRIHCTRLAGDKADLWQLRRHPKVIDLPFRSDIGRPDRDNAIAVYLSEDFADVISEGNWSRLFTSQPAPLTTEERKDWLSKTSDVCLGSDAFFPFDDNIRRAYRSGVRYVAQPGGSIRDQLVIDTCNELGIVMAFTGLRLFHH
ncbi:MAG TPA: phosphoribosylaminoimidazolecarboxamide formyltransferase [Clostridiales bacterium]|jgi:AICAR transformylase/IMP cyclohydrolase PurH|nr:phosphoribosylaminoimidazolecarboxamide formyltransferase [Clostridiales bacterium]